MATRKSWIKAARLRTLPLAISGIIVGSAVALWYQQFNVFIFLLALLTAVSLQVLSNFANDYGDFQKGTDNDHRIGPTRTLQGGEINEKEMRKGMAWAIAISLILGVSLIAVSQITWQAIMVFAILGLLCLLAAYFYTAGKHAYGYMGLGDISVFIFFGILSVSALHFLYANQFNAQSLLPAISIGCFSTGVLNLNNMRDRENDIRSGKITIASKLGATRAKYYHLALITLGWISALLFSALNFTSLPAYLFVVCMPIFFIDVAHIFNTPKEADLDAFLKKLALSTLLFAILFIVGIALA